MYRILVVDDEPQVRDLTSRALRGYGLECDTAADGDEAMRRFEQSPYNAVVTDLRMPRRHGHALAVELLERPSPPKIIVVTGLAAPPLVQDLVSRGVDDIMQKPVNYNVLAAKVKMLAERAATQATQAAAPAAAPAPQTNLNTIEKSLVELTDIFSESLEGLFDIEDELSDPPSSVSDFVTRFAEQERADPTTPREILEAREKQRVRCHSHAIAVPVTRRFDACGEPFKVAIRDVSESGIRLLHTRATNAKYLGLGWAAETLPAADLRVVAKVMRCKPLSPFYDIGGQFVLAD